MLKNILAGLVVLGLMLGTMGLVGCDDSPKTEGLPAKPQTAPASTETKP